MLRLLHLLTRRKLRYLARSFSHFSCFFIIRDLPDCRIVLCTGECSRHSLPSAKDDCCGQAGGALRFPGKGTGPSGRGWSYRAADPSGRSVTRRIGDDEALVDRSAFVPRRLVRARWPSPPARPASAVHRRPPPLNPAAPASAPRQTRRASQAQLEAQQRQIEELQTHGRESRRYSRRQVSADGEVKLDDGAVKRLVDGYLSEKEKKKKEEEAQPAKGQGRGRRLQGRQRPEHEGPLGPELRHGGRDAEQGLLHPPRRPLPVGHGRVHPKPAPEDPRRSANCKTARSSAASVFRWTARRGK